MTLTNKLTAIGDAIRNKTGSTNLLTLDEMATAISGITGGGGGFDEEDLTFTGDCSYKFNHNSWTNFINKYGSQMKTRDITDATYMFSRNDKVKNIPFAINLSSNGASLKYMLEGTDGLVTMPRITGKVTSFEYMFDYCGLKELPDDWTDEIDFSYANSNNMSSQKGLFCRLQKLRKITEGAMKNFGGCPSRSTSYSMYKEMFYYNYALSDIEGIPVDVATYTSNAFSDTFKNCYRLKKATFAMDNGVPKTANWKSQTISLENVGYGNSIYLTGAAGMTDGFEIKDEESYNNFKDEETAYATTLAYSRYNHDSAVETLNSLPDTSAYLASKGGTNTIKFTGNSGSSTDAGAVNTLTEEEIAVATAKGWTVTFA